MIQWEKVSPEGLLKLYFSMIGFSGINALLHGRYSESHAKVHIIDICHILQPLDAPA
jgi:hypothetical protein